MYQDLNIDILHEQIRDYDIEEIKRMDLAEPFKSSYADEELAISHGYLVS